MTEKQNIDLTQNKSPYLTNAKLRKYGALVGLVAALGASTPNTAAASHKEDSRFTPAEQIIPMISRGMEIQVSKTSQERVAKHVMNRMNSGEIPNVVLNGAVLLPPGTPINKAPVKPTRKDFKSGRIKKIKSNKTVLMEYPRLYHKGNTLWGLGYLRNGSTKKYKGMTVNSLYHMCDDTKNTVWVDLTAAEKKHGFHSYVFDGRNPDTDSNTPRALTTEVDPEEGLLWVPDFQISADVMEGFTTISKKQSYINGSLNYDGLIPTKINPTVQFINQAG